MEICLTDNERDVLFKKLRQLSLPMDPSSVEWVWDTKMSLIHGNLGRYYGISDRIALPEDSRSIALSQNDMLPSMAHELYHAYQRSKMGAVLFQISAFRPWAELTVERGAEREEARVRRILNLESCETGED